MRCNIIDCYWNLWGSNKLYSNEASKQCVSESLGEHYDEQGSFKMTPNSKECQGYLSYKDFTGEDK